MFESRLKFLGCSASGPSLGVSRRVSGFRVSETSLPSLPVDRGP